MHAVKTVHFVDTKGMPHQTYPHRYYHPGWYKETRIRVEIGNEVFASHHRTALIDPRVFDPAFNEYLEGQMVQDISRSIADRIKGLL